MIEVKDSLVLDLRVVCLLSFPYFPVKKRKKTSFKSRLSEELLSFRFPFLSFSSSSLTSLFKSQEPKAKEAAEGKKYTGFDRLPLSLSESTPRSQDPLNQKRHPFNGRVKSI